MYRADELCTDELCTDEIPNAGATAQVTGAWAATPTVRHGIPAVCARGLLGPCARGLLGFFASAPSVLVKCDRAVVQHSGDHGVEERSRTEVRGDLVMEQGHLGQGTHQLLDG